MRQNVIMITLDGLRPDRLSCYGYDKIQTNNIDDIAKEGVLFETCIAPSNFTPICHATILTGVDPKSHGIRNPYGSIGSTTIAEVMRENGYKTAGYTAVGMLSERHGFGKGFGLFDEPKENEECFNIHRYPVCADCRYHVPSDHDEAFYTGNWWIDRMTSWIRKNRSERFFIWGHFMSTNPTNEGDVEWLLGRRMMEEGGELSEFEYYDARIKLADERVFGPLIATLKDCNLYDDTIIVVMSDHGVTLGEHPLVTVPWKTVQEYPQHMTLYDPDIRVALIIKGLDLPRGKRVTGMVRSVDVMPTIFDLLGISVKRSEFEGKSLIPAIEEGESKGLTAYLEMLFAVRGKGLLQAIRSDEYKYIRNRMGRNEELYDLEKDPQEMTNIVDKTSGNGRKFLYEARQSTDSLL